MRLEGIPMVATAATGAAIGLQQPSTILLQLRTELFKQEEIGSVMAVMKRLHGNSKTSVNDKRLGELREGYDRETRKVF